MWVSMWKNLSDDYCFGYYGNINVEGDVVKCIRCVGWNGVIFEVFGKIWRVCLVCGVYFWK